MTETISTELPTKRPNPYDPAVELGVLREEAPLSRLRFPDGHLGWLVTNHELVREVMGDRRFSARSELHHRPFTRGGVVETEPLPPRSPACSCRWTRPTTPGTASC